MEGDNMEHPKRIELTANEASYPHIYVAGRFDGDKQAPVESRFAEALIIEGHYILREWYLDENGSNPKIISGIAHTAEEADKRLHSLVKKQAEKMARLEHILNLNDYTKHAPEKLPRGGK